MKIRLKADWVIPAGTEFECCDGMSRHFIDGNYEALLSISPDSTAEIVVDADTVQDRPELFEAVES